MKYIGEHLFPGKLGHFLLIISLVFSLIASFAFYRSLVAKSIEDAKAWLKCGRIAFVTNCAAVMVVFIILYFLIKNHRFEYFYVFKNSGKDLEPKYILSSLWSASEGSFLLWALWQSILGIFLLFRLKNWVGPVMAVYSGIQFLIATMLSGIYFLNWKMGASPFALFKHEKSDLPLFSFADYVSKIKDGNGLNQVLQNYWMVIHPPVLFLGFAAASIPFSFAFAGLLTSKHKDWPSSALPWSLFAAAVLGTGIMMGGAWAYESLSFGGYWAWDPVENASLVPWMVLISGIHTLLVFKHTGRSLRATYLFYLLSFILVIYSTFLTRSGILGDSSVHSFADLGMNFQLLMFLILVAMPALLFYILKYKNIPHIQKEETANSREFWMYIGALVFFFAAVVIIGKTSVPVYNKIFNTKIAAPKEVEYSYNSILIWVAIIIGVLTAITQYLKYKQTDKLFFTKKILWPTIISLAISSLVIGLGQIHFKKFGLGFQIAIWFALTAGVYAVFANAIYIWKGMKGKILNSGASIAHLGFGMMLCGVLISSSKKEVLSHNVNGIPVPLSEDENPMENLTLIKGMNTTMGEYKVTYVSDSVHPRKPLWYYKLLFKNIKANDSFTLKPNAFVNYQNMEGLSANPDAKHYWNKDVFVYITSIQNPEKPKDTTAFNIKTFQSGDTQYYSNGFIRLDSVSQVAMELPEHLFGKNGKVFKAKLTVFAKEGNSYPCYPTLIFAKETWLSVPDTVTSQGLIVQLNSIQNKEYEIGIKEPEGLLDYMTIKVYKFPFINFIWLGTFIMVVGMFISIKRRVKLQPV